MVASSSGSERCAPFAAVARTSASEWAADGVPPYVVFHDSVLQAIAEARPESLGELSQLHGIGPAKLDRYGPDLLDVLAAA